MATALETRLAESFYSMINQEKERIWENSEPAEGYENGRYNISRFDDLVTLYASLPGAVETKATSLKGDVKEMELELPPLPPDPDCARDAAIERKRIDAMFLPDGDNE